MRWTLDGFSADWLRTLPGVLLAIVQREGVFSIGAEGVVIGAARRTMLALPAA
jgi:hypothetical protein